MSSGRPGEEFMERHRAAFARFAEARGEMCRAVVRAVPGTDEESGRMRDQLFDSISALVRAATALERVEVGR